MADPRVSVSLVTYDGAAWLPGCLASLSAQRFTDVEWLILDNGSRDASRALVEGWAAGLEAGRIHIAASPANLGFARAHNRNVAMARGEYVLLLNQDVELDEGFLAAAVAALDARPGVGAVQGRLRQLAAPGERTDRLDTTGLVMGRDRRAVSRAQGLADGADHAAAGPVWGTDGPAPVYRASALRQARLPRRGGGWEVLDEDFFLYKEDVDLAWRLRLLGWDSWYEPAALAWHARGTGGSGATSWLEIARTNSTIRHDAKALSWRNQRLMQIKNEDLGGYLVDLPWILRRELLSLAFMVIFDPRRLSAVRDLLQGAPGAMRKRRHLRALLRRVDDRPR